MIGRSLFARKIDLTHWINWLVRMVLAACLNKCLLNEYYSIQSIKATSKCGIYRSTIDIKYLLAYLRNFVRHCIIMTGMVVMTAFFFTVDYENTET